MDRAEGVKTKTAPVKEPPVLSGVREFSDRLDAAAHFPAFFVRVFLVFHR